MQGYPWISHKQVYPGISRYKSGLGRVSLFQMTAKFRTSDDLKLFRTVRSIRKSV